MQMLTLNYKLRLESFAKLRDLIYESSGIFFAESKLYLLEGRLRSRLAELEMESFEEYIAYLQRRTTQAEELKKIYSLITINETYFFRHPKQLDIFTNTLLPSLVKERQKSGNRRLNLWSAASSSGEELYTLAILMKEQLNSSLPSWRVNLRGTDISHKILSAAQDGVYGRNSFRSSVNQAQKRKYFSEENDRYTIKPDIKKMVNFSYLNLNDVSAIRQQSNVDFLFCRNVLIYFDTEMKKKVIRAFYDVLSHGGYLFLGEAESLHSVSSAFKVEHFPGAFVYKKE